MTNEQESFVPNPEFLNTLLSMGVNENDACEALFCTGNTSLDLALNYVFSDDNDRNPNRHDSETDESQEEEINCFKMVFVVNTSLKMGVGKIAAQVGHACLGLYREIQKDCSDSLEQWFSIGEKKIVLKGRDQGHLEELRNKAASAKIPCYLVQDAGHTQIAPGSVTVLSIFGTENDLDSITGKLSLL